MSFFVYKSIAMSLFGFDYSSAIQWMTCSVIMFLLATMFINSPVIEQAGVGVITGLISIIGLTFFLPIWIVAPVALLFVLSIIVMFINIVYFNIRARITRTQALRLLPSASASDIDALVDLIAINGKKLSDFWMHENGLVAYGQAESLVFVTKSAPWKYHNRPYIYEIQASEFAQCYPNASLHKDDLHNLCAHLYFNWAIEALVIETDKVVITLRRRGEAKKLQYKKETSNANEQDQFKKMAPLTK